MRRRLPPALDAVAGRVGASREGADTRPGGRWLEPLVLTVSCLDGAAARGLLAGLEERRRQPALALLARIERRGGAERRATLAGALSVSRPRREATAAIPGLLGARVRALVGGEDGPPLPERLERWARRLVRELADGRG